MDKKVIGAAAALAIIAGGSGAIAMADHGRTGSPSATGDAVVTETAFHQPESYTFRTLDDNADPTFNQLLGINDKGVIAGYFGSGAAGHPNKGYVVGSGRDARVPEGERAEIGPDPGHRAQRPRRYGRLLRRP